ncbi:hypothetical protein ACFQ1S_26830 [Kibdelosporangium lantanae]|uniref:ESX-1 secretion-associated protein n=1 Tax=Kibdelosporangium lantanae TaxID=1497396 RepID=A0ABW3MDY6_9PSEU
MSADGYGIKDPDTLSNHAGKVADVSTMISEANAAGQQVGLGGVQAYGLLCSPVLIPILQAFQGDSDDLLRSASDLAGALADRHGRSHGHGHSAMQALRRQQARTREVVGGGENPVPKGEHERGVIVHSDRPL